MSNEFSSSVRFESILLSKDLHYNEQNHSNSPIYFCVFSDRYWKMVERLKVNHLYSTPSTLGKLMMARDSHIEQCNLSSLKNLGTGSYSRQCTRHVSVPQCCFLPVLLTIIVTALCIVTSFYIGFTVGQPIKPKLWNWYHSVVGRGKCPILDTWWQTG